MGLGHAVWCARELVGHEPFAMLPDVLVQHNRSCLGQMMIDATRTLRNAIIFAARETASCINAAISRQRCARS
jgi:UTP-glucose-1-phosphate uridylyltransferase